MLSFEKKNPNPILTEEPRLLLPSMTATVTLPLSRTIAQPAYAVWIIVCLPPPTSWQSYACCCQGRSIALLPPCPPSHQVHHPIGHSTWPVIPPCPPSHAALPANQPSLTACPASLPAHATLPRRRGVRWERPGLSSSSCAGCVCKRVIEKSTSPPPISYIPPKNLNPMYLPKDPTYSPTITPEKVCLLPHLMISLIYI